MRCSRREFLALSSLIAGGLSLSACAGIPLSKGVERYQRSAPSNGDSSVSRAVGPQTDAKPADIIEGFIRAGADPVGNFEIAREFLTAECAARWRPEEITRLYDKTATVVGQENTPNYRMSVIQNATLDARGIIQSVPSPVPEHYEMTLVQVEGQWRISACPNGLWLDAQEFNTLVSPYRLYFYDSAYKTVVPDIRWFVRREDVPSIVQALFTTLCAGPAKYLEGAVINTVQTDMNLSSIDYNPDNSAEITLWIQGTELNTITQARLRQQVQFVMRNFSHLRDVQVRYNERTVQVPGDFMPAQMNLTPNNRVIALNNGTLVLRDSPEDESSEYDIKARVTRALMPAFSKDDAPVLTIATLAQQRTQLYTIVDDRAQLVREGQNLAAPCVDSYGWVWSAAGTDALRAYKPSSSNEEERTKGVEIAVSWRRSLSFSSISVACDSARIALVGARDGVQAALISGIVRDAAGKPLRLTDSVRVSSSITPSTVHWAGEQTLVVSNAESGEVVVTTLSGDETKLDRLPQVVHCSAADEQRIYAQTSDGTSYRLTERSWEPVDATLRYVSYAA